jgi:hypothetical protein
MRQSPKRPRPFAAGLLAAGCLSLALASGCDGGTFKVAMEGKAGSAWAGKLQLTPAAATLLAGDTLRLSVAGGDGSYVYSLIGSGSFDQATMVYKAPATEGIERLRVRDGAGTVFEAVISVKLKAAPDYRIALSPAPVFPADPGSGGSAFTGSCGFYIENISAEAGIAALTWKVYVSRDAALDALDLLADSGSLAAPLGPTSLSSLITYTGSWPVAASSYYIIIELKAADDANAANDLTISPAISVTGAARPDYSITSVTPSTPALAQTKAAFTETIGIQNAGTGAGSESASWAVYLSTDAILDALDPKIDGGSITPGLAAGASYSPSFTGSYPAAPGSYYFLAKVSAFDDAGAGVKTYASGQITVSGPRYSLTALVAPAAADVGAALNGSFVLNNVGNGDGRFPLTWSIYAARSAAGIAAGDKLIQSGIASQLAQGASSALIPFAGTWPAASDCYFWPGSGGSYYLIAQVQAADDATMGSLVSSAIALSGPDYNVIAVAAPTGSTAAAPVSGSFTIRNDGPGAGSGAVAWSIYASLGNASFDAGDTLIASGTTAALAAGASVSPTYNGTWPGVSGSYRIIARAQAVDDATIGSLASSPVSIAGPSYNVTAVGVPTGATAGLAMSGGFTVRNTGIGDGSSPVSWSVYASLGNASFDAGDTLLASGTTAALAAGVLASPSYSGTWPALAGSYYLIVRVNSADAPTMSSSASTLPIVVAPPNVDYLIQSLTLTAAAGVRGPGQALSGTFQYRNSGVDSGSASATLSWGVYASLDTVLDAGDSLIASGGGLAALAAGATSGAVAWSGTWPLGFGSYYLIATVTSAEDTNQANDSGNNGSAIPVGIYDETVSEPNGDVVGLGNPYALGITFKPGMSIKITGTLNAFSGADSDDVFMFNTGSASTIVATASWGINKPSLRIRYMTAANSFAKTGSGSSLSQSLDWSVDAPNIDRWLDLDNRWNGTNYAGPASDDLSYSCILVAQ